MIYTKHEEIILRAAGGAAAGFAAGVVLGGVVEFLGHNGYATLLLCVALGALFSVSAGLRKGSESDD